MEENYKNFYEKNAYANKNYSIHTFEFWIPIRIRERDNIYQKIASKLQIDLYRSRKHTNNISNSSGVRREVRCFKGLECKGIKRIDFVIIRGDGGVIYNVYLSAIVNPRKLLGYEKFRDVCIVPERELGRICERLVAELVKLGFSNECILDCQLARIDFCTNFQMKNQEQAERYLKILKKGREVYGMKWKKVYDDVGHRQKFPKNEATQRGENNDLSIYLKAAQMEENRKYFDIAEIEMAEGQIRIEMRTYRRKVHYLEKRYDIYSTPEFLECASEIGAEYLSKYMRLVYGAGKIVKKSAALNLISNSKKSAESKALMERVIMETKTYNFDYAWKNCTEEERKKVLPLFNSLGISPITIPDSWEEDYFENPLEYIKIANVNER